jgi:hypothetical protein
VSDAALLHRSHRPGLAEDERWRCERTTVPYPLIEEALTTMGSVAEGK